jgi:transposase-like protein
MEQDIILKTDKAGRVRTPRERQEQIVSEWKSSGLSAMRFAEAIGVKYQTLAVWIRKHGGRSAGGTTSQPTRWLEMAVDPALCSGECSGLRVELPGGAVLVVGAAGQIPMVIQLLRALSCSASPVL